jgi:DNA-binding NtrC family response regulator
MSQRILLVDDDPAICDLVSSVLEMGGYDVVSANDGAHALDLAQGDGGIGLVLSDVVMPGINGVQLREKLRTLRPELRCILMSGYNMGLTITDKDTYFLPKPFVVHELLGKVRQAFEASPSYALTH